MTKISKFGFVARTQLIVIIDLRQTKFNFKINLPRSECSVPFCFKSIGYMVIMQGKLIAVAYNLRTYWNQFSLGGICKQE